MSRYILILLFTGLLFGNLANVQPFKTVVENVLAFSEQQRILMVQKYENEAGVLPELEIIAYRVIVISFSSV